MDLSKLGPRWDPQDDQRSKSVDHAFAKLEASLRKNDRNGIITAAQLITEVQPGNPFPYTILAEYAPTPALKVLYLKEAIRLRLDMIEHCSKPGSRIRVTHADMEGCLDMMCVLGDTFRNLGYVEDAISTYRALASLDDENRLEGNERADDLEGVLTRVGCER